MKIELSWTEVENLHRLFEAYGWWSFQEGIEKYDSEVYRIAQNKQQEVKKDFYKILEKEWKK